MLLRSLFCATLMLVCATAPAQRVGQSRDAISAEYRRATEENHSNGTAVYRRGALKVDISYKDDIASKIVVTAVDTLNDEGLAAILAAHGSNGTWKELQISGSSRVWQASDLATASCDRVKPRSVTFNAGLKPPRRSQAPTAVPLATAVPRFTPPPIVWTGEPAPSAPATTSRAPLTGRSPETGHASRATESSPVSGTAGQRAAEDAIATVLGGARAAIFTVTFVLLIPCMALVLFLKLFLPLLVKRWLESLFRRRPAVLAAAPHVRIDARDSAPALTPPPLPPASLDNIGWDKFEILTGEIFRRKGYEVEITAGFGADGGKDLTLRRNGELSVVQCKNLAAGNRVTAPQMRDFFGLITAEAATKGFFVTTGYFSLDAKRFAAGKPIALLERGDIERLIAEVSSRDENLCDVQSWLETFLRDAHVVDPACPRCEGPMKLKRGAVGRLFWSCAAFPCCRGKRDGREELLQARQWQGT